MCSTVHADSGRKVTRHKEHWVMNIRSDRNGLGWKRSGRYFHRGTGIVHWMEAGTGIVHWIEAGTGIVHWIEAGTGIVSDRNGPGGRGGMEPGSRRWME